MAPAGNSIRKLRAELSSAANADAGILHLADLALAKASTNPSHNTYLWRDENWTRSEARRIASTTPGSASEIDSDGRPALWGIPVSVKDCFDLAGSPTSCGAKFYRELNGIADRDSWLVERLRQAGAVITGKTHLHPLAYGITGENADFGDCIQPGNPGALTGGSSSGAAASVMEGSAMAAIGTDTGGSIRVPAALCGLAGYRASLGRGNWRGGAHLAASFDTIGWLFRDLEDGPMLGELFEPASKSSPDARRDLDTQPVTVAVVEEAFLHDCEPSVVAGLRATVAELQALGVSATTVPVDWWSDALQIFAPIQASEAAQIHRGHFAAPFAAFDASIRQRLEWGASLSGHALAQLRSRHAEFQARMDALLAQHQFLLMPAAPVSRLQAGADHSQTRMRLLRYTAPVSLAGMPAVTIPCTGQLTGAGMQLVAARENDEQLLRLAQRIGAARNSRN